MRVIDVNVDKVSGLKNYSIAIEYSDVIKEDDIVSKVEYDCLLKV